MQVIMQVLGRPNFSRYQMAARLTVHICLVAAFFVLQTLTGASQTATGGKLRAGAAKVDITPKPSDLQTPTDVILDHIFARAIVVDDGATCAVLIGLDIDNNDDVGVPKGIERSAVSTGCPAQNFIVSATHDHSSNTLGLGVGLPDAKQKEDAIVAAANAAKAKLAPARVGYGSTQVDLNVNRDLVALPPEDRARPNPEFPTDKTLSVVEFIGADNIPIAVYMNYAMHPTSFNGVGVISGDFPGAASRYLETVFDGCAVAIYSQSAEGDVGSAFADSSALRRVLGGQGLVEKFGLPPEPAPARNLVVAKTYTGAGHPEVFVNKRSPISPERIEDYHKAIEIVAANVTMVGNLIGASALKVMREIQPVDEARIWGARKDVSCPGRVLDTEKPIQADELPVYKDGPDIVYRVEVLRIGDLNFAAVNTEPYTEIGTRLKAESPANHTIVVGLANGKALADYTYPDYAANRKVFEVAGSHLKPGCAEQKIISTALELMHESGE